MGPSGARHPTLPPPRADLDRGARAARVRETPARAWRWVLPDPPTRGSGRAAASAHPRTTATLTNGEGLLGLGAVLVVPGRPPRRVDGALAGAQQGRLRLALAGGALPGRAPGAHGWEKPVQGLRVAAAAAAGGGAGARLPRPRATSPPATPHWAWRDWSTWCLHAGTWARPR